MKTKQWLIQNKDRIQELAKRFEVWTDESDPQEGTDSTACGGVEHESELALAVRQEPRPSILACVLSHQISGERLPLHKLLGKLSTMEPGQSRFDFLQVVLEMEADDLIEIEKGTTRSRANPFDAPVTLGESAFEQLIGLSLTLVTEEEDGIWEDTITTVPETDLFESDPQEFEEQLQGARPTRLLIAVGSHTLKTFKKEGKRLVAIPQTEEARREEQRRMKQALEVLADAVPTLPPFAGKLGDVALEPFDLKLLAIVFCTQLFSVAYWRKDIHTMLATEGLDPIGVLLRVKQGPLVRSGLLLVDGASVEFPEDVFNAILAFDQAPVDSETASGDKKPWMHSEGILKQLRPNDLRTEELIVSENVAQRIAEISFAFTPSGRESLNRFGIGARGLAALFFGPPGTGKTLAAMTLASKTGHPLLSVDVARVKSKWFGETEQLARALFREYRQAMAESGTTPILFLNEADQILTTRITDTRQSTDKTLNSVQNIFLEEMENFEGLLIATTNLASTLDEAFSRRFLFKVEFERPDESQRLAIWEAHLRHSPLSPAIDLRSIAKAFPLSGGEIKNAVHTASLKAALNSHLHLTEALLREAAETQFRGTLEGGRKTIGF